MFRLSERRVPTKRVRERDAHHLNQTVSSVNLYLHQSTYFLHSLNSPIGAIGFYNLYAWARLNTEEVGSNDNSGHDHESIPPPRAEIPGCRYGAPNLTPCAPCRCYRRRDDPS